jgi:lipid-binding SYLF domain-containing protein
MLALAVVLCVSSAARAATPPDETVRSAGKVLYEVRTTPGKQIPTDVLAKAQAIVIIPDAVKLGLIGGVRSGRGVAILRQLDESWGFPQLVNLAGGSLGLQVGVEDIDMVLVFMTKRSAEGLASGKFTIGTDASASAGPVGRDANAVTDGRSISEVLSYSRSRGLFVGASIDGARLLIDHAAVRAYYGAAPPQPPVITPEPASTLRAQLIAAATGAPDPTPQGPRYDPPKTAGKSKPYRRMMTSFGTTGGSGT